MYKIIKNKFIGFTLIELLVTITIIGILASTSIATYGSQIEKSRIAKALYFYKQSHNQLLAETVSQELEMISNNSFDKVVGGTSFIENGVTFTNASGVEMSSDTPDGSAGSYFSNGIRALDDTLSIPMNKDSLTLSVWIKIGNFTDNPWEENRIIEIISEGVNTFYVSLGDDPHIHVGLYGFGGGGRGANTNNLEKNKWYHLLTTVNNEKLKIYIDGKLSAEESSDGFNKSTIDKLSIGTTGTSRFYIDNLKIYPINYSEVN